MTTADNNRLSPFHQKLISLLENDVKGWANKLDVSESVIRDRWFKGSYPGVDKIIKLATVIKKIDLNSLLIGRESASIANFTSGWTEDLKNLCLELKEILETADEVSIAALKMNMAMIKGAVKSKAEAAIDKADKETLKKEVRTLKRTVKRLESREPHGCAEAPGDYLPAIEK